jgi:hypothetical protein
MSIVIVLLPPSLPSLAIHLIALTFIIVSGQLIRNYIDNLRNKRAGHDVVVYFDGLGSRVPIVDSPYKGLRPAYEVAQREGVIYGVCGYCASPPHLNIRDKLTALKIRLIGDEEHHEDLSIFINNGYQILVF